jgi:hypothetical protein
VKRVEIQKDLTSPGCKCTTRWQVVELDASGKVTHVIAKAITNLDAAKHVMQVALDGKV